MMKLICIIITVCAFISCDGRERAYMTNEALLKENNLFEYFSEKLSFYPEYPVSINTDTILSNGFQIKLNYQVLENDTVIQSKKNKQNTTHRYYYKNTESQLHVLKNNQSITHTTINKALFRNFETQEFWARAIMQYVWLNQEASTTHSIQLNTTFHIPNTEIYKDFILTFFDDGTYNIKKHFPLAKTI